MSLYKTKGIVLKSIDLGEADKIITLYSTLSGRISAVAKGIRRTKSKFGGRLEPFTYLDLLLYKGRNLDIVTQAEIIHSFQKIRENLDKIFYGSAILDLVNKASVEGDKSKDLFSLLLTALETLEELKGNISLLLTAFQLKLMAISGYLPALTACIACHSPLPPEGGMKISVVQGGVLCPKCNQADINAYFVSPETPSLLNKLLKIDRTKLSQIKVAAKAQREMTTITEAYINYYLEARLKSHEFLAKTNMQDIG